MLLQSITSSMSSTSSSTLEQATTSTQKLDTYHANGALVSSVDYRDLDALKREKWNDINTYREVMLNRGIWYLGYNFGSDERSRANLTGVTAGVAVGIPLPENFTWRDNNNNMVPFDATKLVTLGGYVLMYVNMIYAASWAMKTVVDACTTLVELDKFFVPAQAWPDNNIDGSRPS